MQYTYGAIFLLSLVLIPLYFILLRKKQDEPWLFLLCVCVAIVNLGYTMISFAKTVEFALFANKITYLGQVMMPLCMFVIISRLCGYRYKKWVMGALIGAAAVMLAIVCTTGHLDWYYVSATIETVAGATVLHKEYGVLHPLNLVYVIAYFVAMITVVCISFKQHKGASQKHAAFMLAIVLGNIGLWCIQKIIPWDFELLSCIYPVSTSAFLVVWYMLQDYVHKRDIPKFTPAESERLGVDIATLSMEVKIGRVLATLPKGEILATREREVLEAVLENKKRREIAQALHLSENTVKTYTRNLYNKLGVSSREELYKLLLGN